MKHYRRLTKEDRIGIYWMLQEGKSIRHIARSLDVAPSTISREIRRNTGQRGYRYKQAHQKATDRQDKKTRAIKMTPDVKAYIDRRIRDDYSPEQISGTMYDDVGLIVSHEWIYQYIYTNRDVGADLINHLRVRQKPRRRKRRQTKEKRGKIPHRVGIENRPEIVNKKQRIGDWEADLVSGAYHRGFLVTLVDRKTKYTLIGHVNHKRADAVRDECLRLLMPYRSVTHTITYDNGKEFSRHEAISDALKCMGYFANPYHSWERGLNENTNGLIRQYFPKGCDLRDVSHEELEYVMERLNNRPRKTLDFQTPKDMFFNNYTRVALVS